MSNWSLLEILQVFVGGGIFVLSVMEIYRLCKKLPDTLHTEPALVISVIIFEVLGLIVSFSWWYLFMLLPLFLILYFDWDLKHN